MESGQGGLRVGTGRISISTVIAALLGALALLFATAAGGADAKPLRGVALVVGIGAYDHLARLANPAGDAHAVADLLERLGFETTMVRDADARRLGRAVERFVEDAQGADAAIVYYSGHGIEAGGDNWLLPSDTDPATLGNAAGTLVSLSRLLDDLDRVVPLTIVLLDACRDNPLPPGTAIRPAPDAPPAAVSASGLGLPRSVARFGEATAASAPNEAGVGALVGFAAAPGKVALDGEAGANSPYAAALLRHVSAMAGEEFGTVMRMVAEEVYLKTAGRQQPWINENLRRLLYLGVAPEPVPGDDGEILAERRQLLLTISTLPVAERRQVERVAAAGEVSMDALYGMLRALGQDAPKDPFELAALLQRQAGQFARLRAERAALDSEDPELHRLVALAERATDEGALQAAVGFHEAAKLRVRALETAVDEAEARVDARRREFAAVHAGSAAAYLATFAFDKAAADFAEAFRQVEHRDPALAWRYKDREMQALVDFGEHRGGADAFLAAIEAGRVASAIARGFDDPDRWITSLAATGDAMVSISRINGDPRWLDDAVDRYGTALELVSQETAPLRWAWLQSSVGTVHLTLGERQAGTRELRLAVDAYRAAVAAAQRADAPFDLAQLENNLGNALFRLGQRERGPESLAQAVAAYRAALEQFDPVARRRYWLSTLNNLGKALHTLGERSEGVAQLLEAIEAQRRVLAAQDRAVAPLQWASTQNDLGNVLLTLGLRTGELDAIDQSLAAFQAAATEWRRDVVPVQWAMAMNNLGSAYLFVGRDRGDPASLERSIAAYRQALEVRRRDTSPADWAATQHNLATALATLGEMEPGTAHLVEALGVYRQLLELRSRETDPVDWAGTQHNLGRALRIVGEREKSADRLSESVAAFRAALDEFDRVRFGHQWASSQAELAEALFALGEMRRDRDALAASAAASRAAVSGFDASRGRDRRARVHEYLARATFSLGTGDRDPVLLAESAAEWTAALALRDPAAEPILWLRAQASGGLAELERAKITRDRHGAATARAALVAARDGYAAAGQADHDPWFADRIGEADALLAAPQAVP